MSLYSIGAIGNQSWTITNYKDLAKTMATRANDPYMVVSMEANGKNPGLQGFMTRDQASTVYDNLASRPGAVAYLAVFEKADKTGQPYDEAFFVAQSESVVQISKQSVTGWVAAGIATIFGLMIAGKKKMRS